MVATGRTNLLVSSGKFCNLVLISFIVAQIVCLSCGQNILIWMQPNIFFPFKGQKQMFMGTVPSQVMSQDSLSPLFNPQLKTAQFQGMTHEKHLELNTTSCVCVCVCVCTHVLLLGHHLLFFFFYIG
jgi:glycerol uptake facilitator-like aquaporin